VFCEDEAHIQRLIRVTLRHSGHDIFMAADGDEGWETILREQPDLIFTDVSMPHCDGFQLTEKLRHEAAFTQVPVVFLTAFGDQPERQEGYRLGAVDYLIKPFSPAALREKIASLVQD
jgi:DNA-binding response OmpR family regulator